MEPLEYDYKRYSPCVYCGFDVESLMVGRVIFLSISCVSVLCFIPFVLKSFKNDSFTSVFQGALGHNINFFCATNGRRRKINVGYFGRTNRDEYDDIIRICLSGADAYPLKNFVL